MQQELERISEARSLLGHMLATRVKRDYTSQRWQMAYVAKPRLRVPWCVCFSGNGLCLRDAMRFTIHTVEPSRKFGRIDDSSLHSHHVELRSSTSANFACQPMEGATP